MSLTIRGLVVYILATILSNAGFPHEFHDIEGYITTTLQVVAAIMIYWGRYRKGDINAFGMRK
jgi:hypothetical protein